MQKQRTYSKCLEKLNAVGLRPTKQRLGLARLLFERPFDHVTAEQLHKDAHDARLKISLATVYNTLNQFSDAGLVREVVLESSHSYFCTNPSPHHHMYNEATGEITDIPVDQIEVSKLPNLPDDLSIASVDVVIRVNQNA
ncbi:iron response transcriptional regulator IrrA [Curvivirga aplysinae]|uniref:iron response transcriptional regulator IrrA n=1 Tax=Curvivirga aplysinae TaxID=2529852 RepID=UPI0012BB82CF|nr:Fur family transcriptional regulator [Curvivirga aplysinae]MTI10908.1 transcriptional repressor [Curvivirga aplysinae]